MELCCRWNVTWLRGAQFWVRTHLVHLVSEDVSSENHFQLSLSSWIILNKHLLLSWQQVKEDWVVPKETRVSEANIHSKSESDHFTSTDSSVSNLLCFWDWHLQTAFRAVDHQPWRWQMQEGLFCRGSGGSCTTSSVTWPQQTPVILLGSGSTAWEQT